MSRVFDKQLWTKQLRAWYLYDFGIALPTVALGLYFSQWVTVDNGVTDFRFALPFMLATAVLIFLSPLVGAYGDRTGNHHRVFIGASVAAVLSAILVWVCAKHVPATLGVVLALCAYGLFQFFSQLAFVPYTTFIKYIAPRNEYGRVSGFGYALHEFGQAAGIFLALPFALGVFLFFGSGHVAPLFFPGIVFLLLALPAFIALRAPAHRKQKATRGFFAQTVQSFRDAKKHPGVRPLLLSFYLYSDATASILLFAAIYLEKVLVVSDAVKAYLYLVVIAGLILGSFIGGLIADSIGHRRALLAGLIGCTVAIIAMAIANTHLAIMISFPLFGFFGGVAYATSRSLFASLIPKDESGKYFGLYTFSERFASIIGPALWGLVVWVFRDAFPLNYRYAVIVMGALVALSVIPVLRIREKK